MKVRDISYIDIQTLRSSFNYGWYIRALSWPDDFNFGYVPDRLNVWYDGGAGELEAQLELRFESNSEEVGVQAGDRVRINYDTYYFIDVILPAVTENNTVLYVGRNGNTYRDLSLCMIAKGTPTATNTPTPTPTVTPACSPCQVQGHGYVYDRFTNEAIAAARVDFDWADRCGQNHSILFTTATGYYETPVLPAHLAGEGSIRASCWGYQTEIFQFPVCGWYYHEFYLEPLPGASSTPTPRSTAATTPSPRSIATTTPTPLATTTTTPLPQPSPTSKPTSVHIPTPTPACSPGEIRFYGYVYNRFTNGVIPAAHIQFDWVDRCWQSHLTLFATQTGAYEARSRPSHTVGEGKVQASSWGYQTEVFRFFSGGSHYHEFYLEPLINSTPSPTGTPAPGPTPTSTLPPAPRPPVIESGDYDGDGIPEIAIFRQSNGLWSIRYLTRIYFGGPGDIPIPGDYNGDGTADIGIRRGNSALWAIRRITRAYFGSFSDYPVPGDYDGDDSCEMAIFREDSGLWSIPGISRAYFGTRGDAAVPGDYNGDGTKDIALFRPDQSLWIMKDISRIYFGTPVDLAAPGDYDADKSWEAAVFRASCGLWIIRGLTRNYFGSGSDQPVPADYDGDSIDEPGIFREASGLWFAPGVTRVYFGAGGDQPVTR